MTAPIPLHILPRERDTEWIHVVESQLITACDTAHGPLVSCTCLTNGNEADATVEWLEAGSDLSSLAGQPVRLEIRMRGTRLYGLQFKE